MSALQFDLDVNSVPLSSTLYQVRPVVGGECCWRCGRGACYCWCLCREKCCWVRYCCAREAVRLARLIAKKCFPARVRCISRDFYSVQTRYVRNLTSRSLEHTRVSPVFQPPYSRSKCSCPLSLPLSLVAASLLLGDLMPLLPRPTSSRCSLSSSSGCGVATSLAVP